MYQDERKLLALISVIIVAGLLLFVQIDAARSGRPGPIIWAGSTAVAFIEQVGSAFVGGVRDAGGTVISVPQMSRENASLRARNEQLQAENARLQERLSVEASAGGVDPVVQDDPDGIEARVIGFPPENESRTVTIDRGSRAG